MSKLPEGWIQTKLENVCKIEMGQSPPSTSYNTEMKGLPFYQGKAEFGELYPIPKKYCITPKKIALKNDILLSIRAPVGPTNLCAEKTCIGRGLAAIRPIITDYKYLLYFFRHIEPHLSTQGTGSTFKAINKNFIVDIDFCLPPLNEQKRIADKLDQILEEVNSAKARLDQIPTILKNFRQSVLEFAVNGYLSAEERKQLKQKPLTPQDLKEANFKTKAKKLDNPSVNETVDGWLNVQIGHLFSVRSGKGLTAKNMTEGGTIPVYGGNGINGYHDEFNMDAPAVVIGRVGFYCGSVHYTEEKSWITDNALIVSFPEEIVSKKYAYFLLKATNLRGNMASSAQPVISGKKIYPVWLTIPPKEEQKIIINKIEDLMQLADQIEEKYNLAMESFDKITQSVLAKAFRGELVPQDPNDEPASVLLERIKETKTKKISIKSTARISIKASGKATVMSPISKENVLKKISEMPQDKFTFDELSHELKGDYNKLQEIVFELLDDTNSALTQKFDEELEEMLFVKRK